MYVQSWLDTICVGVERFVHCFHIGSRRLARALRCWMPAADSLCLSCVCCAVLPCYAVRGRVEQAVEPFGGGLWRGAVDEAGQGETDLGRCWTTSTCWPEPVSGYLALPRPHYPPQLLPAWAQRLVWLQAARGEMGVTSLRCAGALGGGGGEERRKMLLRTERAAGLSSHTWTAVPAAEPRSRGRSTLRYSLHAYMPYVHTYIPAFLLYIYLYLHPSIHPSSSSSHFLFISKVDFREVLFCGEFQSAIPRLQILLPPPGISFSLGMPQTCTHTYTLMRVFLCSIFCYH
jgi:hypothetical protein